MAHITITFDDWGVRAVTAERAHTATRALLAEARDSLAFIRSWSDRLREYEPTEAANPLFKDFWSWAEGWDCDLEPRLNALLRGERDGEG